VKFNERVMIRAVGPTTAMHPGGRMVLETPETVVWSPYWIRRLGEGAIVVVEEAKPETKKAPAKG
jgi:hypothetical protein